VATAEGPCVHTATTCVALNPAVTEATIGATICHAGYTRTVRPPTSYTNAVKVRLLLEAGLDPSHAGEYELDHIVPLALGGAPRSLSNLQLQPWPEATTKDRLEVHLQHLVCHGEVSLAGAQQCIAVDWRACAAEHP
jgi:hypothetical protein